MSSRRDAQWVDSVTSTILDILLQWHEVAVADACPHGSPALEVQALCRNVRRLRKLYADGQSMRTDVASVQQLREESAVCQENYRTLVSRWGVTDTSGHAVTFAKATEALQGVLKEANNGIVDIVRNHTETAVSTIGAVFDLAVQSVQTVHATIRDLRSQKESSCEIGFKQLLSDEDMCTRQCSDLRATWTVLQHELTETLQNIARSIRSPSLMRHATRVLTAVDAVNQAQAAPGDCTARAQYFSESIVALQRMLTCLQNDGPKSRARCVGAHRRMGAIDREVAALERRTATLKLHIAQARGKRGISNSASTLHGLEQELARERELDVAHRDMERYRGERETVETRARVLKQRVRDADNASSYIRQLPRLLSKLKEFRARSDAYQLACRRMDDLKSEMRTATDAVCHAAACKVAEEARRRFRSVYESARTQYAGANDSLATRVAKHLEYYRGQAWQHLGVAQQLLASGAVDASGIAILGAVRAGETADMRARSAAHGADTWILAEAFMEPDGGTGPGPVFRLTDVYASDPAEYDTAESGVPSDDAREVQTWRRRADQGFNATGEDREARDTDEASQDTGQDVRSEVHDTVNRASPATHSSSEALEESGYESAPPRPSPSQPDADDNAAR